MSRPSLSDTLAIRGPLTAADLRGALGISRATLSRLVAVLGSDVLRLGKARAIRYALPRRIAGLPTRLPAYRIDASGHPTQAAELIPVRSRGTWVEPAAGRGHLHEGLPPVVVDMAPAGYLGRRFAKSHPALELPARLEDWSDDHRLISLARRGEDAPGDLVIGEESLDRFLRDTPHASNDADYPELARASAEGGAPSSAAGDQPKFTAYRAGRHYIVKFAPAERSPSGIRWRDLLACEATSLLVLRDAGIPVPEARVLDVKGWRFLEVSRFDRVGPRGRRGVLTLGPLDDDLSGGRDSWPEAAARLHETRLLRAEDARRIRLLEAFGMMIFNGDRHFGNLSFFADGLQERPELVLAPAYDMLPMDGSPRAGVVPPLPDTEPAVRAKLLDVWDEARVLARKYWRQVAEDRRISGQFRKAAARLAR
ncbi:MAG: type II toxin-antitoxin system HipA family toxin YjjJ [Deltaproteobacteria bacterium]